MRLRRDQATERSQVHGVHFAAACAQHPAEASRFGVSNLIVVATSDATLITTRDQAQRVKELVAKLKDQRLDRYL